MPHFDYPLKPEIIFDDILQVLHSKESVRRRYSQLHLLFVRMLNDSTSHSALTFSGPYARLDHLCRQMNYPADAVRRINAFRIRAMKCASIPPDDLDRHWLTDVKALCDFVAAVHSTTVPTPLANCLPVAYPPQPYQGMETDVIRGVVRKVENDVLSIQPMDYDNRTVAVALTGADDEAIDFRYIKELVSEGDRINVIQPILRDGVYYPQLIVYQPDFLVDISTIASCFESYANSPLAYLLSLISPSANSKAIQLGNYASQLLDEAIHHAGAPLDYASSVRKFFRNNAVRIATCPDMDNTFHKDAKQQQEILQYMVNHTFREISGYDADHVLLEPSFFCEMLGVQGRMDLLQDDMRVLIEQKSGKRGFGDKHQEKHYVQVLLYRALLQYNFRLQAKEIDTYLLYSKFRDGLMKEGGAPHLLAEAFKMRNQLVHLLMRVANGESAAILDSLTLDTLNQKGLSGNFWNKWIMPQLVDKLKPLENVKPLTHDYFHRLLAFVAREHILAKVGSSNKDASGLAAMWNSTQEEKREAGNLMDAMIISSLVESEEGEGISEVVLSIGADEHCTMPNFRVGDVVVVYQYKQGESPNPTKTMVLRSTIKEITPDKVTIALRAPQKNASVFHLDDPEVRWAAEHDFIESTTTTLYRSVAAILTATPERSALLLGQREPRVEPGQSPMGNYGPFDDMVRRFVAARDLFILIGPPGTGKTSMGLVNMLKEEMARQGSVLLLSFTNRAVNEICAQLVAQGIDFLRLGGSVTCPPEYREHLLSEKALKESGVEGVKQLVRHARVVVSTTSTMLSNVDLFTLRNFSLAIIDEASQILEPHLLGILCARHGSGDAISRFVLIGDHKQLPAVVQQSEMESRVNEASLREIGLVDCRLSLFERLLTIFRGKEGVVDQFASQGRMHPEVASFPSEVFYQGRLKPVPVPHQTKPLAFVNYDSNDEMQRILATHRIVMMDVRNKRPELGAEKVNHAEAETVAALVNAVYELYMRNGRPFDPHATVGVIVPYRHQIAAIKEQLKKYDVAPLQEVDIDTVERYQGSQREVIIYGFTVQREHQLNFLTANSFLSEDGAVIDRKLNVALTRAREQMVMVGNAQLLSQVPVFARLIDSVKARGMFIPYSPPS